MRKHVQAPVGPASLQRHASLPVPRPISLPRTRKRHELSDGESDSENPNILYRALRPTEKPVERGLWPPAEHDPRRTAAQHITSGSRAKDKGPWISATRSRKVAAAWAGSGGRIVKFKKPKTGTTYDMTNPAEAVAVFPSLAGRGMNSAKASQEVLIRTHVLPANILAMYSVTAAPPAAYREAKTGRDPRVIALRTRTTTASEPSPLLLTQDYPPPRHTGVSRKRPHAAINAVPN
ncbi:hypothetical protein [Rugamonas aquatica]|uniref:Uncharacterized protein n=1 Tax=Rugamonas aquatica TaxID=2743357 RepID=A0A6A7N6Y3_9BURK|nr:hypothetical protein [Rugamonas aquatica]MQA40691.1 hypothetical protein [Rugamonas aquatica]